MYHADLQHIIDDFELLGDWEQRYQYLVELGEHLPAMPVALKTPAHRVIECMSVVHVAAQPDPAQPEILHYSGDCDTAIIKGAVALLVGLLSGKTAADIINLDVDALFQELQLEENLSPNRHVGIYAIVNKMKAQAAALQ